MNTAILDRRPDRRSGLDRRSGVGRNTCTIGVAWPEEELDLTIPAAAQKLLVASVAEATDQSVMVKTIPMAGGASDEQLLRTLGTVQGLVILLTGSKASKTSGAQLQQLAVLLDLPVLRVACHDWIAAQYAQLGLPVIQASDILRDEQGGAFQAMRHLLERARRRPATPLLTHNALDNRAQWHAMFAAYHDRGRRYTTTPRTLHETKIGPDGKPTRGVRISLDRYCAAAAAARRVLLQQNGISPSDLIENAQQPNKIEWPTLTPRQLQRIVTPNGSMGVAIERAIRDSTHDDSLPKSTQAYACIRLWRAHGLLRKNSDGQLVMGDAAAELGGVATAGTADCFFHAALKLYAQLGATSAD